MHMVLKFKISPVPTIHPSFHPFLPTGDPSPHPPQIKGMRGALKRVLGDGEEGGGEDSMCQEDLASLVSQLREARSLLREQDAIMFAAIFDRWRGCRVLSSHLASCCVPTPPRVFFFFFQLGPGVGGVCAKYSSMYLPIFLVLIGDVQWPVCGSLLFFLGFTFFTFHFCQTRLARLAGVQTRGAVPLPFSPRMSTLGGVLSPLYLSPLSASFTLLCYCLSLFSFVPLIALGCYVIVHVDVTRPCPRRCFDRWHRCSFRPGADVGNRQRCMCGADCESGIWDSLERLEQEREVREQCTICPFAYLFFFLRFDAPLRIRSREVVVVFFYPSVFLWFSVVRTSLV